MGRMRTVKPEFFTDPKIGALSPLARLLYIGLWTMADEVGNCPGDPRVIRATVLPFEEDSGSTPGLLRELEEAWRIVPYTANGERYYHLPYLGRHQLLRPDRRTYRFPAPPPDLLTIPPTSGSAPGPLREDSGRTPAGPVRIGSGSGPGRVPEGIGGDRPSGPSPPAASPVVASLRLAGNDAPVPMQPGLKGARMPAQPVALIVLACAAREGSPWSEALPVSGPEWDEWALVHERTCPAVDLKGTVAEAYAWSLRSGAHGRKRNLRRFLGSWFTREQDKPDRSPA